MKTSKKGISAIKMHEALRLTAYLDTGGVWTIGYGHTGSDVHEGLSITEYQAELYLVGDLQDAEKAINKYVDAELTQNQFDALVSFVYNIGTGQFRDSTLLRKLNALDYIGASEEFLRWKFDNGRVIQGLLNRREKERAMFLL